MRLHLPHQSVLAHRLWQEDGSQRRLYPQAHAAAGQVSQQVRRGAFGSIPCFRSLTFPPRYIYEPWKAPLSVQKEAGCIIGKDYPKPIVDHDTVSKANMGRLAEAYAAFKRSQR